LDFLIKDKDITSFSNFRTPARARFYFEIKIRDDVLLLSKIFSFAKSKDIPVLFVWWWTNMFFAFNVFSWVVIKNSLNGWSYDVHASLLSTFSNEVISDIAEDLENRYSQSLWHRFIWLPWSIWWAVHGNAWCFWLEVENNFLDAELFDILENVFITVSKSDMDFAYRCSLLKTCPWRYFIVSVRFDLSCKVEKYHSSVDNIDFRNNKQPSWYTCWSFFKNPVVDLKKFWQKHPKLYNKDMKCISAWFLLESSWMKWYIHGWAFFSPLHANFLMSDWDTTYTDVLELIWIAQKKVMDSFWIHIENEVWIVYP
jgi:UDP-N-acetylenolpyruvoylglucosamine reductase